MAPVTTRRGGGKLPSAGENADTTPLEEPQPGTGPTGTKASAGPTTEGGSHTDVDRTEELRERVDLEEDGMTEDSLEADELKAEGVTNDTRGEDRNSDGRTISELERLAQEAGEEEMLLQRTLDAT